LPELLPWRSFTIETSWSPEVAAAELAKEVSGPMLRGGGYAPFEGRAASPYDFEFSRRIEYRNSFLPVVRTAVEASHRGGARVRVTMRMNPFVFAFTALWMSGATVVGGLGGLSALLEGHPAGLIGLAFPLFGAALCGLGFGVEARKAEAALRAVYAAAPGLPPPPDTGEAYR
jgi:hypothetical protein